MRFSWLKNTYFVDWVKKNASNIMNEIHNGCIIKKYGRCILHVYIKRE